MRKIMQTKAGPVLLTDGAPSDENPLDERSLGSYSVTGSMPIIGIGLDFKGKAALVVESKEQLNDALLENTARHFYHLPVTVARTRRLLIREMTEKEIPLLFELDRRVASPFVPVNEYAGLTPQQRHETFIAYRKWAYETLQLGLYLLFEKTGGQLKTGEQVGTDDQLKTGGQLETGGQLVGRAGFAMGDYGEADVMLSYEIVREKRRQGYALEASQALLQYADSLGVSKIAILTDKENEASRQLALRLGFARDGICQGKEQFLRVHVEN